MLFDPLFPLVGPVGFEPTLLLRNTVLSRARLPFRHGPKLYFIVSLSITSYYFFFAINLHTSFIALSGFLVLVWNSTSPDGDCSVNS